MYSEQIIEILTERIGFGLPQESGFVLNIDETNSIGASGRLFKSFHSLVTIENIFAAIDNENPNDEEFNAILTILKQQAVYQVLTLILNRHEDYVSTDSYDAIIQENIFLFDEALGYKVCMMVLEMYMSTKRSNISERNAKLSISNLKLELEGYRNETGVLVAKGLVQKFESAVKHAVNRIFPFRVIVKNGEGW